MNNNGWKTIAIILAALLYVTSIIIINFKLLSIEAKLNSIGNDLKEKENEICIKIKTLNEPNKEYKLTSSYSFPNLFLT